MNIFSNLKERLVNNLEATFDTLIDENLGVVMAIKETGLISAVNKIVMNKNIKNLNLLSYALMLNRKSINKKIEDENIKIFLSCLDIKNSYTFNDVMKSFFGNQNDEINTITKFSDISVRNVPIEVSGEIIEVNIINNDLYINPYTNTIFRLESGDTTEIGSSILSTRLIPERTFQSKVIVRGLDQLSILDNKDQTFSGLYNHYNKNDIVKFNVEFTVFHELAHLPQLNYKKDGQGSEMISDICGALKVIKNNHMTEEQATSYINYLINWRSESAPINFYLNKYDNKDDNIRIHSTQFALLNVKKFIKEDFNYLKNMSTDDELVFASHLSLFSKNKFTLETFMQRTFDGIKLFEETAIEKWINSDGITSYLNNLSRTDYESIESLKQNIKDNLKDQPAKIFDFMCSYLSRNEPEKLLNLNSYSLFVVEIIKEKISKEKEERINNNLDFNFSHKQLKNKILNNIKN